MPRQSFIIDLRFDGGRQAEQVLQSIGETGDRSMSRLSQSSQPARRGLLAVNDASQAVRGSVNELADRLGPVAAGFRALGPAGTAAAAGIAAGTAGLVAGSRRAEEATLRFAELGEQADQLGVSVQALQELRFAASQVGVEESRLEDGLQELNTRISELQSGAGELNSFLEDLGAQGLRQSLRGARDTEEAFQILIDALKEGDNAFDNAALAAAAFGEEGGRAIQRLANQDVAELRQAFRDLGIGIDEDLVRRSQEARGELAELDKRIQNNVDIISARLLPVLEQGKGFFADLTGEIREATEAIDGGGGLVEAINSLSNSFVEGVTGIGPDDIRGGLDNAMRESDRRQFFATQANLLDPNLNLPPATRDSQMMGLANASAALTFPGREVDPIRAGLPPGLFQGPDTIAGITVDPNRGGSGVGGSGDGSGRAGSGGDGASEPLSFAGINFNDRFTMDDAIAETIQLNEDLGEQSRAAEQDITRLADTIRNEVAGATADYSRQLTDLNRAYEAGAIDQDTYRQRADQLAEQFTQQANAADGLGRAADQLGFTFSSAFEDAIINGERLSSVLQGLAQDIARIALRKSITEPAGNFIADVISGGLSLFSGGASTGGAAVPSSQGGLGQPLPTFAQGGIADRPSIFGEAGPEAAVPLPNGREIPVRFQGGGTTYAPVINVTVQGAGGSDEERRRTGEIVGREVERAINRKVDARIRQATRPGGQLNRTSDPI